MNQIKKNIQIIIKLKIFINKLKIINKKLKIYK